MSLAGDLDSEFGGEANFNFWDPKQYSKTVKRYENGHRLCVNLASFVTERADIEKAYSSNLKKWNQKWEGLLETGFEYGTSKYEWQAFLKEATDISDIHNAFRNKLGEEIYNEIKQWQKDHYHKVNLPTQHFKEVRVLESEFEQTQKPWNKRLKKVNTCKKEYHNACKQEKSCSLQLKNCKVDGAQVADQVKKLEDKLKKAEKEVEKSRTSYEAALQDLDSDSTRYMEEMDKIFKKSQEYEQERKEFFKSIFEKILDAVNLTKISTLPNIYDCYQAKLNEVNHEVDLKNWSISYGAAMLFEVPQFEDYSTDPTGMPQKKKYQNRNNGTNSSVELKSITTNDDDTYSYVTKPNIESDAKIKQQQFKQPKISYDETLNPFGEMNDKSIASTEYHNDYEPVDDIQHITKVRALYDYKKVDVDEISLTAGMVFEMLEDEDEQGWCKGRANGVVGLYPANYAEPI